MNRNSLSLSIVIPVYNEEDYIGPCLDAISSQTVKPDEIIVVDNNCTDRTLEVARKYPNVKIIKEANQGRVFARNRGLNAAKSQLIGRIDADSILPHDWVETVLKFYDDQNNHDVSITGGASFYNLPFKKLNSIIFDYFYFKLNRLLLGYQTLYGSNMVIPSHVAGIVINSSCGENAFHEDIDLSIHLREFGYKSVICKDLVAGVGLRNVIEQKKSSSNRFSLWRNTLKRHGKSNIFFDAALVMTFYLYSFVFGAIRLNKRISQ